METVQDAYVRKTLSLDELFDQFIVSGTSMYTGGLHVPSAIIHELMARVADGRVEGIDIYGNWMNGDFDFKSLDVGPERFRYHTYFAGPNERAGFGTCVAHIPAHFSQVSALMRSVNPDYAVVQMTPPDARGMCNIGPLGFEPGSIRACKGIIAQVNSKLPRVFGDSHDFSIDEIDAFIVCDEDLEDIAVKPATSEERACAALIVDRIDDGDCIQLGIGGILNAVAEGLMSKRHLGCFTEMYSDALVPLQQAGVIDNSRNSYFPGRSVGGYSTGAARLYEFIDRNPEVYYCSYDTVTNPYCIAKNDNMVSINTAISIDLTGQVCAESIGSRQYSASGGQADFVRGARMAKNGRSFIAVTSVAHTRQGPTSKIVPMLAPGSAVTTLRNDVQYVVTEYGVADLAFQDVPTRAKRLIAFAHPDFRDELTFEAKRLGLLY